MSTPSLKATDAAWQREYDRLMRDPYLARKYDRERRLREHLHYLQRYAKEVFAKPLPSTRIVDVGCGAGETLEWARVFGWNAVGVEAPSGEGGMGEGYWRLSQLLHERQKLTVLYCGWRNYIKKECHAAAFFNFRGSWAQSYADFLDGPPHHVHHDCHRQAWRWGVELQEAWRLAFDYMASVLVPGGHILIAANDTGGSTCRARYNKEMQTSATAAGLKLVREENKGLLLKWVKP